jgi:hypothetical protein
MKHVCKTPLLNRKEKEKRKKKRKAKEVEG